MHFRYRFFQTIYLPPIALFLLFTHSRLTILCKLRGRCFLKQLIFLSTMHHRTLKNYKLLKNRRSLLFPRRFDLFQVV